MAANPVEKIIPIQPNHTKFRGVFGIAANHAHDPTKSCVWSVYFSRDGGNTWQFDQGSTWVGGLDRDGNPAPPPTIQCDWFCPGVTFTHVKVSIIPGPGLIVSPDGNGQ